MLGGEVGPGREVASVEGGAPSGDGGREKGGMVESNSSGDGGVAGEEGVDAVRWLMVG